MNLIITLLFTQALCEIMRVPLKYHHDQKNVMQDMANMLQKSQAELLGKTEYSHLTEEGLIQMSTRHKKKNQLKHQPKHDKHNHKIIHDAEDLEDVRPLNEDEEKIDNSPGTKDIQLENKIQSQTYKSIKGDVPFTNIGNTMFFGEIKVGNNGENNLFKVIFGTTVRTTLIISELCNDNECRKSKRYDHKQSTSFKEIGIKVERRFGSGTITGLINSEVINVNGIMLKDVQFIEITELNSKAFITGESDGYVGLSLPVLGMPPTLFDYMMVQHKLDQNEFTFHLSREVESSESEIIFGGHDDSKIKGQWHYHGVADPFDWVIMAEQIRVGENDSELCTQDRKCELMLQTGHRPAYAPSKHVEKILSMLKVEPKCQDFRHIPDITFVIDGVDYILTPEDYMLTYTNQGVEPPYVHSPDAAIISCTAAIFPMDTQSLWILGEMFITKYSAIFDRANLRVGLGLSAAYKQ